ncbi:MAG: PQQ-binding-like beta-propeller repeat protein [Kiritimatiellaeota bacterium]|nr:PQQ-binding-like beta-propeller repeat protein [Kiritimatiellota bacterium]
MHHHPNKFISRMLAAAAAPVIAVAAARGADWPAYRHDMGRSGLTSESLPTPLHLQWTYQAQHKPRPAWPEPGRELNRQAFDYAAEVIAANGLVLFGSSADHKLYALDSATGAERWSFFTGAPIRFAPAVADGRVFVASDDGFVRCLNLVNGSPVWEFYGGPKRELMFGNEQLVGKWPIRTGVGVDRRTVYFAAGMWPSEGVYLYALRASDGSVVWRRLETATHYQKQPHPGSYALLGVAPQGYLVGNDTQMFIPTGRNVPAAFARADGKFQYYRSAPDGWGNRWGGTWNMVVRDKLIGWRNHHVPDVNTVIGEAQPTAEDGLVVFDAATGNRVLEVKAKLRAVADGAVLYASGGGKLGAYDLDGWFGGKGWSARWESDCGRTYALVKAGNSLIAGQAGAVSVYTAGTGKKLWEARVEGQARSLAVADGRLFVSTTTGQVLCFGAGEVSSPPIRKPGIDAATTRRLAADPAAEARARSLLETAGIDAGYCLILARVSAPLLYQIAKMSKLTTLVPEPDAAKAEKLRRDMDKAGLYGPRCVVQAGSLTTLRYPTFFANLIWVGADSAASRTPPSSAEIYRLLRPCGGTLYIPLTEGAGQQSRARLVQWLERGGVPEAEIQSLPDAILVRRGKLPKSDNWSHQYGNAARTGSSADERVKLPLRLLWFGKPGPATIISRHWQGPAPLCVNGRMFITGQQYVTAVDAYNGRMLWQRKFPRAGRWSIPGKGSNVAATADSFFMATGGQCERLDAGTGKFVQTYALPKVSDLPKDLRKSLDTWCFLAVDGAQVFGSMGPSESAGKCLFSLRMDSGELEWAYTAPGPIPNNGVSVTGDALYLIERISDQDADLARRRGLKIDAGKRLVALDRSTGAVRWTTREKIGSRTTLWFSNDVVVAIGGGGLTGYAAATGKVLYSRTAGFRRSAVITKDTIYVQPLAFDLYTGKSRLRNDTFTNTKSPWNFVRSYGCGSMGGGPNLLAFRSGTLGFYGLDGDTGIHNFPAVRAGCCINAIPANGLLLMSPGDAGCSCSYSYQTTLALIPDTSRDNWGIFYDRLPNTTVQRVSLNLGAPGDRRAKDGTLWLAMPRPETRSHRRDIAIPFRYTCRDGFGPYYKATAPEAAARTDLSWVNSSGIRGIRHLELDLDIVDRGFAAWYTAAPPTIDGNLQETCWDGYKAYPSQVEGGSIMLRYDRNALYLGCSRPLPAGTVPKAGVRKKDGPVWEDGAFEILISNLPERPIPVGTTSLHMAVSPSGAKYDAKWTYVSAYGTLDIPKLAITIDGDTKDWADGGLRVTSLPGRWGRLLAPENLDASFRIGWSSEGLLILADITDNAIRENSNRGRLYRGDSVELFMTPRIGSGESFQVVIAPGVSKRYKAPRYRFYDRRRATRGRRLSIKVKSKATENGYIIEALLPWSNLKIKPKLGAEFGLQVFVNDSDRGPIRGPQALWHPAGSPAKNALAYQGFRLADAPSPPIIFKRSAKPDSKGLYTAVQPHAFPLIEPPLGAQKETASYNGQWRSAVQITKQAFQAEIAIPWKTLADAGLDRQKLMIDMRVRGPLPAAPRKGAGFEQLLLIPMSKTAPRLLNVRLHFADPDNAAPGRRVFDIKLQGRTVLADFDLAEAAKIAKGPVTKEFRGISAVEALFVDFVPKTASGAPDQVPVISGIEFETTKP